MHSIEDIIANAQSAVAESLRAAYNVGREHQTVEMRDKFVAFFEGVIGPFSKSSAEVAEASPEAATELAPTPAETAAETPAEAVATETTGDVAAEAPAEAAAEPTAAA